MYQIEQNSLDIAETMLQYLPPREILWMMFLGLLVAFLVMAIIFAYHWRRHGQELSVLKIRMSQVQLIFYIGAGAMFLLMILAILFYPK